LLFVQQAPPKPPVRKIRPQKTALPAIGTTSTTSTTSIAGSSSSSLAAVPSPAATAVVSKKKKQQKIVHKYKVKDSLAFHAIGEEGQHEPFTGIVIGTLMIDGKPCYRLHYFDEEDREDVGGCYSPCSHPDDPNKAWTQDVLEEDVLLKIKWLTCSECEHHMGDDQWDEIESTMNTAHADAYSSESDSGDLEY
jgi:hypothetical protein